MVGLSITIKLMQEHYFKGKEMATTIITVEKNGSEINIFGRDEYGSLITERYFYHSKKEAIKLFKEKYDLKYQRGIKIITK